MSECIDNQEVGLEAAILERVRNSSLVKCSGAENVTGLKPVSEAMNSRNHAWIPSGRRAFPLLRSGRGSEPVELWEVRMSA
jgi:hypothetical protein